MSTSEKPGNGYKETEIEFVGKKMSIKQRLKNGIRSLVMMAKEEKKIPIPVQMNMTEMLKGKTALITGGSGGIGMAIAESFLKIVRR